MAEIFKAKSFGAQGFQKILAIKRILPAMAEDEDFITMFIDEAKIVGQLAHENICQIFELGKIDSAHFIAMEYVRGKDVLQIQNRYRRLKKHVPLPLAAYAMAKVCAGLDHAHRKRDGQGRPLNIVHRDVSPQNVLVSYEGEVKIIDFGIAKAVSRSSKTQAGVLKGKFGYMSPEQVRGLPLDGRSDVFALGTVLWEVCTGKRLFSGPSDLAVLEKVRNSLVQPPSSENPEVDADMEAIIMKALDREASGRYEGAGEMQEALEQYLHQTAPEFSVRSVSEIMREIFAEEVAREDKALAEYRQITEADLPRFRRDSERQEQEQLVAVSLLHGPGAKEVPSFDDTSGEQTPHEATEVGDGPLPLAQLETAAATPVPPDPATRHTEPTQILDPSLSRHHSLATEPTFIFDLAAGVLRDATGRPLLTQDSESGARHFESNMRTQGPLSSVGSKDVVLLALSASLADQDVPQAEHATRAAPSTAPLKSGPPSSTLWRDILVGVGMAIGVLLALFAVLKWQGGMTTGSHQVQAPNPQHKLSQRRATSPLRFTSPMTSTSPMTTWPRKGQPSLRPSPLLLRTSKA